MTTQQRGARTAGIQVIQRAASILRAIRDAEDGLSLGQIAEEVGLARSTVQRIVAALQLEGWVAPASPNARVRIGPGLADFAVAAEKSDHTRAIHPLLVRLSRELQETVDLAVLEDDHVLSVDQVAAAQRLRAVRASAPPSRRTAPRMARSSSRAWRRRAPATSCPRRCCV